MIQLNVNTDAAVIFTNKLERMSKTALPKAVRSALNSAAFDVKQNTMPKNAKRKFINRQANFFKANSRVEMAKGSDIHSMKATVGFVSKGLKGDHNFAVEDLEGQEHGGRLKGKSFIPTRAARGGNEKKNVKPVNRISRIKNIVSVKNAIGVNYGQKFIKSVIHAGKGGHVLAENKGKQILWRVNSLKRLKSGAFKLTALYTFKRKRSVSVKQTNFMRTASLVSAKGMENHFIKAAKYQLSKV